MKAVPAEQTKVNIYTHPTVFRERSMGVVKRIKGVVDLKMSYLLDGLSANPATTRATPSDVRPIQGLTSSR
jgi:ABC-type uncharacterized transport system substrate-binding protein